MAISTRSLRPGVTATSGLTGTDPAIPIIDGTAEWKFVHKVTFDGQVTFGSKLPHEKVFFTATAPEDAQGVGYSTYFRHDDFRGVTGAHGFAARCQRGWRGKRDGHDARRQRYDLD